MTKTELLAELERVSRDIIGAVDAIRTKPDRKIADKFASDAGVRVLELKDKIRQFSKNIK